MHHCNDHTTLHQHLEELSSDFLAHNPGKLLSGTTIIELMEWSHRQVEDRPAVQKIELTYFKPSGKYYSTGKFEVSAKMSLNDIWDHVKSLLREGKPPGLIDGPCSFIVLVNAPGHPHEHPKLLNIKEAIAAWEEE